MLSLAVADLAALGYRAPGIVDDPANGGNGDGFVCGVPSGNQTTPRGTQLYLFFDNSLGAERCSKPRRQLTTLGVDSNSSSSAGLSICAASERATSRAPGSPRRTR